MMTASTGRKGVFRRLGLKGRLFRRSDEGAVAIEFAMLAIPFFMLLFAIIESCIAYAATMPSTISADSCAPVRSRLAPICRPT
jgi:Flp pilus assembly protein TadG